MTNNKGEKIKAPKLAYTIKKAKDGVYVAKIPVLYLVTYGNTKNEAIKNLVEAEEATFRIMKEDGIKRPTYEESLDALDKIKVRRKGGGRKPINEAKRRSVGLTIQITPKDKKRLSILAKKEKKTLSTFAYDKILMSIA